MPFFTSQMELKRLLNQDVAKDYNSFLSFRQIEDHLKWLHYQSELSNTFFAIGLEGFGVQNEIFDKMIQDQISTDLQEMNIRL